MRILLINATARYGAFVTSDWDRTAGDIGAFPPIGLSYIAGYLQEYTDHEIQIIDCLAENLDFDEIEKRIKLFQPNVVGSTVFTPTFYDTLLLARLVKRLLPDCYFCVGGINHLRLYLEETLSHKEIDFAIRGEGEIIFSKLIDALGNGKALVDVQGISFEKEGKIISNGQEGYIEDVNSMPPPAFNLLPIRKYKSAIGTGNACGTIVTSRGCPHECTYCDRPYRTYRSYASDRIIAEMKFFCDKGIKEFVFFDDMFNLTPQRVIDISERITANLPDITWSFRGRVDQVSEEMIVKAKKSGCTQIMFGVEAAKDEDLRAIKKKITTKQVLTTLELCRKKGLETSTNWIIGLPVHKNKQDIVDLLNFVIKSGTNYTQFNIMIPYEGTEIFDEGAKKNILPPDFWRNYVKNPIPHAYIPMWNEYMSREELSELLKMCYKKFYLRPSKIIEQLFRVKGIPHFKTKMKGALTIMGFGGFTRTKKERVAS